MILPTTYWGTLGWWERAAKVRSKSVASPYEARIEMMESYPKQTFRNRCIIIDPKGTPIVLSVPVKKVDHKQFTRDVEISYQTAWQHQHWNAILSAYKKTPYFDYYQDFIRPLYEHETRFLVDFNEQTLAIVSDLLANKMPDNASAIGFDKTTDWAGLDLEDTWGTTTCILDKLFKLGPLALQ